MKDLNSRYIPYIIILLCFISRIPQLASPHLLLDGDECVVAVAAKHIYDGKDISLFFLGQRYGFSLIESLFIIPFYSLLGITALAVKLAMLALWTIGVLFLYKTLVVVNKGNRMVPFLLILVFIGCPAWAMWAMKARGGYLTAFTLSSIIMYLVFHPVLGRKLFTWLAVGVLLNFVYQSQLFWLTGLVPLVVYGLVRERSIIKALLTITPLVALILWFQQYKLTLIDGYNPTVVYPKGTLLLEYIWRSPKYFYHSLHGNYYFGDIQNPNFFCAFVAAVFLAGIIFLFIAAGYHLFFKRKGYELFIFSNMFMVGSFGSTLISEGIQGRYLLPVTGFTIFALQVFLNRIKNYKTIAVSSAILTVSGMVGVITFWDYVFLLHRKETIIEIVKYFDKHNIKYSVCTETMVPWQIIFYSQERHICRTPFLPGRYPLYTNTVSDALDLDSNSVGLVRYTGEIPNVKPTSEDTFYFFSIGYGVSKNTLKQNGFYFNE